MGDVTVGIDIGTTSVKALAADADGAVIARCRVPHALRSSHPGELAHDARAAWHDGPLAALATLLDDPAMAGRSVAAIDVAAMVPSLCAVDAAGVPISDGLLYGDDRGAPRGSSPDAASANPAESGELVRFLEWLVKEYPDAAGYWPAQAVANAALSGAGLDGGVIDTVTAMTAVPLFDYTGWDPSAAAGAGLADIGRLPRIVAGTTPAGSVPTAGGALLGGGTIDAFAEQLVAGADGDGDVLVILGATLIVWAVIPEWREIPGLWTVPHTAPGLSLIGGPSNAGGLFMNWTASLAGRPTGADGGTAVADPVDPARVPIWLPHLRGERVPLHDARRRASLHDLDIGMGSDAVARAAREASGFTIRHIFELAGVSPTRLVCTGGGSRDVAWVQALCDATGVPADVVSTAEGGALGAACLARSVAGLDRDAPRDPARWSRVERRHEPDESWCRPTLDRYERYRSLLG